MRRLGLAGALIGCVGLALFLGCGGGSGAPRPGDLVTPQLAGTVAGDHLEWRAGQPASLGVRLVAQGPTDKAPRSLNGTGIPLNVNPVAAVRFYQDDTEIGAVETALSHRC